MLIIEAKYEIIKELESGASAAAQVGYRADKSVIANRRRTRGNNTTGNQRKMVP